MANDRTIHVIKRADFGNPRRPLLRKIGLALLSVIRRNPDASAVAALALAFTLGAIAF